MRKIELPSGAEIKLKTFEEIEAEAKGNGLAYQPIAAEMEKYQELRAERPFTQDEKTDYEKIRALFFQALAEEEEDAYLSAMNSL